MPLMVAGGLLGLIATLWMAKGIGHLHGLYAKALLVGRIDGPVMAPAVVGGAASAPQPVGPTESNGGVQ